MRSKVVNSAPSQPPVASAWSRKTGSGGVIRTSPSIKVGRISPGG